MKRALLLAMAAAGLVVGAVGACNNTASHIFIARQYDPKNQCVEPSEGIDVVDGPAPTVGCTAACLTNPNGDVYVSGMCPPYPFGDTVVGGDAGDAGPCAPALAAYGANTTCDAGISDAGAALPD